MVLQQTEIEGLLQTKHKWQLENPLQRIVESEVANAIAKFNETIKTNVEKSNAQVLKDGQNCGQQL